MRTLPSLALGLLALVGAGSGCGSDCKAIGYLDVTTITIPTALPRDGVTFTICIDDSCSVSPSVNVVGNTVVSNLHVPEGNGEVVVTFTASTIPPANATLNVRPRSVGHGCNSASRTIDLVYDTTSNTLHKP